MVSLMFCISGKQMPKNVSQPVIVDPAVKISLSVNNSTDSSVQFGVRGSVFV
jgi:hypothetical protein